MRWSFFREVRRKSIHLFILLLLIVYSFVQHLYGKQAALMGLILLLLFFLVLEYFRLDLNLKIPIFDNLIRPKEIGRMYSMVYFISATIISLAVFDFRIALAALLMASIGDMMAGIIGQRFGHTTLFHKKTLVGGSVELVINIIIGFIVLFSTSNLYTILAMAFMATIVEILVDHIDDNLIVPLFTGFIGQLLYVL